MSELSRATGIYDLSPYRVAPALIRSVALTKIAAARCNTSLGYLDESVGAAIERSCRRLIEMNDDEVSAAIPLDAFQGGAGTSTNMAVNEWIAADCDGGVSAFAHANLHQSTNDVMPTALRLMMHDAFCDLEGACETLQGVLQEGETEFDAVLKPARTQLREALVTSVGRDYATWAHAIARDRWRFFKARERIREVNLGGTAIGSGAGAPRRYVLRVITHLQQLVDHPISRAEHLTEATSNYDQVVEAMDAVKCLAVDLRRIASDLRLLSSGPMSAIGELVIPKLLRGSSIMAGKVNPVIPEAVVQCAERILSNDAFLSRLAAMSELQLNAFFPAIAHTVYESVTLSLGSVRALCDYLPRIVPDADRCRAGLESSHAQVVALLPLVDYTACEALLARARSDGVSVRDLLVNRHVLSSTDADALFSPENLTALGYDETLYDAVRQRSGAALKRLVTEITTGAEP